MEHETLTTKEKEFWEFSFQDMKYDIKANLEHIYGKRGKQVHYIGLSQGAASMLAALADPEDDVSSVITPMVHKYYCMAPVLYTVSSITLTFSRKVSS